MRLALWIDYTNYFGINLNFSGINLLTLFSKLDHLINVNNNVSLLLYYLAYKKSK